MTGIRALLFDVFGTLVDWRTCVAREAERVLAPLGVHQDWLALADAWRGEYQPAMEEVRSGRIPFGPLDGLHRRNLDVVLGRLLGPAGAELVPEAARRELNLAWHRLDAWPDVPAGLARLRERFLVAPCSNGNVALLVALARRNDLRWDAILGAELARDYKPKPGVYLASAAALGCAPEETLMVAAHSGDLAAAAAAGLRTAFVRRPLEFGPGSSHAETAPAVPVDVVTGDLQELASVLQWASADR